MPSAIPEASHHLVDAPKSHNIPLVNIVYLTSEEHAEQETEMTLQITLGRKSIRKRESGF